MSQRRGAGVYRYIQDGAWTRNAAGQTQPQMPLQPKCRQFSLTSTAAGASQIIHSAIHSSKCNCQLMDHP